MLKRIALWGFGAIALLAAAVYIAFQVSPWPSALLVRYAFAKGDAEIIAAVEPFVPKDVTAQNALSYDDNDPDARLDVFAPATQAGPLPAVVWIHGGGFVAGTRDSVAGYIKIIASHGYVTFTVDYTLAPEAPFPTPVRQVNAALAYIVANAAKFNIDPARIFLAGDSAGAHIAAQSALVITDPTYAESLKITPGLQRSSLRGLLLYCGPYDPTALNFDGSFGGFMRTVIWSYVGTPDPKDPRVAQMSLPAHMTAEFPPFFISVGNADPLAPQSTQLADAARAKGVEVDALFFPQDYEPPLSHEYQFYLSKDAAKEALDRSLKFLAAHDN